MTKHERNKIQDLESAAWEKLCIAEYHYVRERFPFGYGYEKAQLTNYRVENNELRALLYSWHAYDSVMIELGIPTEHSEQALKYSKLSMNWLEGIK